MPPNLDIYIVSRGRDRATIERFFDDYVDRIASQDRVDEQLMILPMGALQEPGRLEDWDWEPAKDLTHIIQRGLDKPPRAFTVCLKTRDRSLSDATLAFTTDGRIILGLSIDDEGAAPENTKRAKLLLHDLAAAYEGERGWVGVEMPPPLIEGQEQRDIVVYHWSAS